MTDLWESCPMKEKPTHQSYDLMRPFESATYKLDLEMWGFLEKVKAEYDCMSTVLSLLQSLGVVEKGDEETGYDWFVTNKFNELKERAEA